MIFVVASFRLRTDGRFFVVFKKFEGFGWFLVCKVLPVRSEFSSSSFNLVSSVIFCVDDLVSYTDSIKFSASSILISEKNGPSKKNDVSIFHHLVISKHYFGSNNFKCQRSKNFAGSKFCCRGIV